MGGRVVGAQAVRSCREHLRLVSEWDMALRRRLTSRHQNPASDPPQWVLLNSKSRKSRCRAQALLWSLPSWPEEHLAGSQLGDGLEAQS